MSSRSYENNIYVTFDVTELNTIDFSQVMETSIDTVVKSTNGEKTLVKYQGSMPSSVAALTTKSQEYSHSEILVVLATPEWSVDPSGPG